MAETTTGITSAKQVTLEDVKRDPEVEAYIDKANEYTGAIGYTEHGSRHANLTASIAYNTLKRLGNLEREAQLAAIAAYLHDIGNLVSRVNHEHTGAVLANGILERLGKEHTSELQSRQYLVCRLLLEKKKNTDNYNI